LLPATHLFVCLIITVTFVLPPNLQFLAIGWSFVMLVDLPASVVAYALAWKLPLLSYLWILVAGTLWWYVLNLGLAAVFSHFKHRNERPSLPI
jgi:hypothetical protein